MDEKVDLCKIRRTVFNKSIKAANICNILPRAAVCNGLFFNKLKQDFQPGFIYIFNQFANAQHSKHT